MKKVIRLVGAPYLNYKGIILGKNNPTIEWSKELESKLAIFIRAKKLIVEEVEELEEKDKKVIEVIVPEKEIIDISEEIKVEKLGDEELNKVIEQTVEEGLAEEKVYTKEQLVALDKKDLIIICKERGIEVKTRDKVEFIENKILEAQVK